MPAQERVRRHERLEIPEGLSPQGLGLGGEAAALGVGASKTARAKLFPENAILLLQIVDGVVLLLVDPACDGDDEKLQHVRKR